MPVRETYLGFTHKYRGLTLLESMLVIAVIITIVLVGHRQYQQVQETKRVAALQSPVLQAKTAVQRYYNSYCNDLVTDFVALNLPNSGLSTSGLKLRYGQVSPVSTGIATIALPYTVPSGMTTPWLGEIKSHNGEVTLYLTLWVPYTESAMLDELKSRLGAEAYGSTYPNSGGRVSQGRLLIWSWPATQEAGALGNVRMGVGAAANAAFVKANIPSFRALSAGSAPKLNQMPCQLVPSWLANATGS